MSALQAERTMLTLFSWSSAKYLMCCMQKKESLNVAFCVVDFVDCPTLSYKYILSCNLTTRKPAGRDFLLLLLIDHDRMRMHPGYLSSFQLSQQRIILLQKMKKDVRRETGFPVSPALSLIPIPHSMRSFYNLLLLYIYSGIR